MIHAYQRIPLLYKIFAGMLLGALIGILLGPESAILQPIGTVFLNLLKMAALPLIIFNLIAGIASLSDGKVFGRVGIKIMFYYVLTTLFAMIIGLLAGSWFKPGVGFVLDGKYEGTVEKIPSFSETLINLIPSNIFKTLTEGRFDQIIIFSLLVGISILFLNKEDKDYLSNLFDKLTKLFSKLVGIVMGIAPLGVLALMAVTVGKYGPMLAGFLAKYLAATYLSILLQIVLYTVLLVLFSRTKISFFYKNALPLIATSLSTSSSLASVPVSLNCADNLGIPRSISSFTIPLGSQVNKDGNGIMLALTFLFASQAVGADLSLAILFKMILLGLVLTTGAGGVPGGGIVTIAILVDAFGLPLEIVAIVAGVFALIDMGLTMLNCLGDLVGSKIVAKQEEKRLPAHHAQT
ncbi:dicarboxylate/amino acid:cation symporter [Brevibacillus sp. AY1]|uniref:dicarboxylate/amino acid:cation symporter n=1 Tax=Brevibacillus sp. AY1 TaxID=2807621 RepID=UPI002456DA6D|nr:dicarboxylate/amino acid:cation symporter [Brevibacillus sp. AY1]MDH4619064.1 dicarboxylate/amino acid:cation symporter [Brevibacillus sp. AY1]